MLIHIKITVPMSNVINNYTKYLPSRPLILIANSGLSGKLNNNG